MEYHRHIAKDVASVSLTCVKGVFSLSHGQLFKSHGSKFLLPLLPSLPLTRYHFVYCFTIIGGPSHALASSHSLQSNHSTKANGQ